MVTATVSIAKEEIVDFLRDANMAIQADILLENVSFPKKNLIRLKKFVKLDIEVRPDGGGNIILDISRHSFLGINLGILRKKAGDFLMEYLEILSHFISNNSPYSFYVLKTDGNIFLGLGGGIKINDLSFRGDVIDVTLQVTEEQF